MSRGDLPSRPDGEEFLDRWSRLKKAGGASASGSDPGERPRQSAADASGATDHRPSKEAEEETFPEVPPIDSLNEDSDYTVFLSSRVPEEVRTRALRRLFHLPQFNVTDGLDDYSESFRGLGPLGSVVTHEMRRRLERELEGLARGEPPPATVPEPERNDLGRESERGVTDSQEGKLAGSQDGRMSPEEESREPTEDA